MHGAELAELVEFSEANAYESLLSANPTSPQGGGGMSTYRMGSAVGVVTRDVSSSLNMNRVIGLGIVEPTKEVMLDEVIAIYKAHGLAFGIEISPYARPAAFLDWLRARRLRKGFSTSMHFRVADKLECRSVGLTVVRAAHAQCDLVADICCRVFRMPAAVHAIIARTAMLPGWRQWLVHVDDRPIGAALSFVHDGIGWLGWDATLPEFRGMGAQSALIAHRVSDAAEAGCRYVTSETIVNTKARSDPSYRNYERLGFYHAYERATYVSLHRLASAQRVMADDLDAGTSSSSHP